MDRQESVGGGGMTGATGDLVSETPERAFDPGERREAEDPLHHADMTNAQARRAPAQHGDAGQPGGSLPTGGPTNLASRDDGYGAERGLSPDDPAYRMERHPEPTHPSESQREPETQVGGDEFSRSEPRF